LNRNVGGRGEIPRGRRGSKGGREKRLRAVRLKTVRWGKKREGNPSGASKAQSAISNQQSIDGLGSPVTRNEKCGTKKRWRLPPAE